MTITFDEEYSQYWQTVIQTMVDGLMIVDPEGIILSVNNAFEHLTGYTLAYIFGNISPSSRIRAVITTT